MQTIVIYSNYTAAKNEKLFPNPEKFDPERWKRDERNAFAMLPFGFGPRSCYGGDTLHTAHTLIHNFNLLYIYRETIC